MPPLLCFFNLSTFTKKKKKTDVNDSSSPSVSIITVHISFWLYRHDQHARYSPEHIDLHLSLSVLVMRYVSVCFVYYLNSLLPITGILSDRVAAITSSHSGLDCRRNGQIVVVNSVRLWVMFCVCGHAFCVRV